MSEPSNQPAAAADDHPAPDAPVRRMAPWKKALLVGSIACMGIGIVLQLVVALSGPPDSGQVAGSSVDPLVTSGFATEGPDGTEPVTTDEEGLGAWSPAIFRFGFSFFVGFCISYALRTFLRMTIIVIGVILLVLFGLQYAGVIDVNWEAMGGHYDSIVAWLGEQTSGFGEFIRGYLPSAAMGTFGAVVGFRRG
ncbi:MAG: FUN14 domain-containing protein [Planctomycetota bacterium]|jgi:uncharacterized membrane protein (Fun14 family)